MLRIAAALAAALALAGCGDEPQAAPSPSPTPDFVTSCTSQLEYWAGQLLDGPDKGYDYQHMGLSMDKYEELRVIVRRAKQLGANRPADWVHEQATAACKRIAAKPKPTGGGWP